MSVELRGAGDASLHAMLIGPTVLAALQRREAEIRLAMAQHAQRLQALVEASIRIHAGPTVDDVVKSTAHEALKLFHGRSVRVEVDTHARHASMVHDVDGPLAASWMEGSTHPDALCVVAQPLTDVRNRRIGMLTVVGATLGDTDLALLAQLARTAVGALENAWLLREATEAARSRDEVLAVVSHDLRNPLGAISMGAAMLHRSLAARGPDLADDVGVLVRVERACRRMDRLIEDLLDASRLDVGTFVVLPRTVLASELVRDALESSSAAGAPTRVTVRAGEVAACRVMADPSRVLQLFSNLVGNAMKFTPAGGSVVLSAERVEGYGRFSVTDTGPGIPAADIGRLFERFWKGEGNSPGGHGLGLYIARGIVEAHHGRIEVHSEPGHGTTFTFTLPLAG